VTCVPRLHRCCGRRILRIRWACLRRSLAPIRVVWAKRPPSVTPLVAMRAAAHRDSIARQWANDFADVFGCGLWEYAHALERWDDASWATTATYLRFMSQFPDSHVLRKYGMHVARDAQRRATELHADLWRCSDPIEVQPRLIAWDMGLKVHGHNPGTSADLTVATLFAFRCT